VIEGEVLTPAFIERVLDTVFVADDGDRPALEAEAHELERQIGNLTDAIKLGGNIPALVESLTGTQVRLTLIRRQLEPREAADRSQLREALDQRVAEWKQILRANPGQGRQVLHHLLGIIQLWVGEASDLNVYAGADPRDRSGKENITMADVRWSADAKPAGLLAGLRQSIGMASPPGPAPTVKMVGARFVA